MYLTEYRLENAGPIANLDESIPLMPDCGNLLLT